MRPARRLPFLTLLPALFLASAQAVLGVILLESDDLQRNTTTPGDNSGWQYEGQFGSFLGTPIAPQYFITAQHIGGTVGGSFVFHGETYTTTAVYPDSSTDLQIWQVDHPFADYAPLYQSGTETGLELRVHGRGTQRGSAMTLDNRLRGWAWGPPDSVQRWGRNVVARTLLSGTAPYLVADFDNPGVPDEAHLSAGDSAGGVFVLEDGLWKLAGVNYGVDDLYATPDNSTHFVAAIFDARGYYAKDDQGNFYRIADGGVNVPTSFYSTRIAPRLAWINSVIGQDTAALAPESYPQWLTLYYTPDQIADAATTGTAADPDGDGIPNLLEFAFNLDPTYAEHAQMVADTGLRGLPLVQSEASGPNGTHLTVEYVRRTAASGSGITYRVQFSSGVAPGSLTSQSAGIESVTPINARWERVKTTDTVGTRNGATLRIAQVKVAPVGKVVAPAAVASVGKAR